MKKLVLFLIIIVMLSLFHACAVNEARNEYEADERPEVSYTPELTIESETTDTHEEEENPACDIPDMDFIALTDWVRYTSEPGEKNSESLMAHNIYSDPSLNGTGEHFTTFTIDFLADDDAVGTYWALCNWEMETKSFKQSNNYSDVSGGGAYAGLQHRGDGKLAIMSFWELSYKDSSGKSHVMNAKRVYPSGETTTFGNEGSGTNYITPYKWKSNSWYRMVLHCWEDPVTGHTFVGQWVCELKTGVWTLISYFDTGLNDSCFTGSMSQFMENFDYTYYGKVRSFRYKNIYVRRHDNGLWCSLDRSNLSVDTWYGNKKGKYIFGAEPTFFWGAVCGLGEDQAESANPGITKSHFQIEQPEEPVINPVSISSLFAERKKEGTIVVSWELAPTSTPQLGYEIAILDSTNSVIHAQVAMEPEANSYKITKFANGEHKVLLTVMDLYGQTVTMEAEILNSK